MSTVKCAAIGLQWFNAQTGCRVRKKNRLTRSNDIQRVRRKGKSFAHQLVVLLRVPSSEQDFRVGIIAGKSIGGAVQRNHAKRWIRAAIQEISGHLLQGFDILLIARKSINQATYPEVVNTINKLARQADLLPKQK
jgi:ribonuclease P protein component